MSGAELLGLAVWATRGRRREGFHPHLQVETSGGVELHWLLVETGPSTLWWLSSFLHSRVHDGSCEIGQE